MTPLVHHTLHGRSWAEVAAGLQHDPDLRSALTRTIAASPHTAVFWECVPVSRDTTDRTFAFVLAEAPALAGRPVDPHTFDHLFTDDPVVTFPNLQGDAELVVPTPRGEVGAYPHLAAFVREGPSAQVHAFWQAVGTAVQGWWAERGDPVWTSTSGLGVTWLHVRLDRRPKYYTYRPFKRFEG